MDMGYRRGIMLLMLVAGAVLLLAGIAGFCSLYASSDDYERAVATVRRVQTKRVYRARKLRYDSQMLISYSTPRYGLLSAAVPSYCPFRREGDEVVVWYRPDRPRDIRRPRAECCVWGLMVACGLLFTAGGVATMRREDTNLTNNQK